MGLFSRIIPDHEQDNSVFDWSKDRWIGWHVAFFIIFSLVLHGSSFYLFQVVYPSPVRVEQEPAKITILDESDPAIRFVLQRVRDRTVYLRPPSDASTVRQELSDHNVRFAPSFESIGPRFLPPDDHSPELSGLFQLNNSEQNSDPELDVKRSLSMEFSPVLSERGVAPWSILSDYLEGAGEIPAFRADFSVLPDGTIIDVSTGSDFDPEVGKEVAKVIESTLRFNPLEEPNGKTVEGWVKVGQIREAEE